jgi:hypothetical protein
MTAQSLEGTDDEYNMNDLLKQTIESYKADPESVYSTWFIESEARTHESISFHSPRGEGCCRVD